MVFEEETMFDANLPEEEFEGEPEDDETGMENMEIDDVPDFDPADEYEDQY